jgi:prepilin peptidase CpaA
MTNSSDVPVDSPLTPESPAAAPAVSPADAAFRRDMQRIPFLAIGWAAAAILLTLVPLGKMYQIDGQILSPAPLLVISVGMLLAAIIDGYAFKVPNWVTLALVVSGWYLGLAHDLGFTPLTGVGGIGSALANTILGFALLFPLLLIRGMGEGDVKMTMGFGSWMGAYFGLVEGAIALWWSFAIGALVGGVFGVVIIIVRGRYRASLQHTREIGQDLNTMATDGVSAAARRSESRRKEWIRLPYGVPLCVGFLGYLAYLTLLPK